ncbi:hypothetical protein BN7_3339 [Wickerhamomyces ciferrii]|uniref:Uncharacterized protein n=1 Tax=Wickerhamomyces ciferrii (strain ATCC 14091 / BCRC 22168 / CBS 111 / JCM 3599 / NBRC 0793 / NRRL Y-1031 F-60-10) TaxID=1206466 RepID=K0KFA2_WICCF|nr:uncharacterized protein BN7_3339 [Wickerhamomyces ciferrii]CCH43785.1 hypothetical protein BN7_3339 [Wickerhamomyces ciferrii]
MAKGSKGIQKKTIKSSKTPSKLLKKTSKSTTSKIDKLDASLDLSEITLDLMNHEAAKQKKKSILDHKDLKKDHDKDVATQETQKQNEGDMMKQLEMIGFKA